MKQTNLLTLGYVVIYLVFGLEMYLSTFNEGRRIANDIVIFVVVTLLWPIVLMICLVLGKRKEKL